MDSLDSGSVAKSLERIANALEKITAIYSNPQMLVQRVEKFEYPEPFGQKIQFEPYRSGPLVDDEYLNIVEVEEED